LRLTHRIVRPVHTIHRALDALSAGDLGVRVALERQDEFHEVGETLNRLVEEFGTTLGTVHALVDRLAARTAKEPAVDAEVLALIGELNRALEFFRLEPRHTVHEGDR
jgi:methyl-accepting chemotaxis protein